MGFISTKCYLSIKALVGFTKPQCFIFSDGFSLKREIQLISLSLALRATSDLGISRGLICSQLCKAVKRKQRRKWNHPCVVRADKMHMSQKYSQGILKFLFSRPFLRRRVPSLRKLLLGKKKKVVFLNERSSKQHCEWMDLFVTTKPDLKKSESSCRSPL